MRCQRFACRAVASGLAAGGAASSPAAAAAWRCSCFWTSFCACFSARSRRPSSQALTHAGGAPVVLKRCGSCARISSSASPCLHGNLRLGQLHLKTGPLRSTWV